LYCHAEAATIAAGRRPVSSAASLDLCDNLDSVSPRQIMHDVDAQYHTIALVREDHAQ
jgi:hypothetical protein